MTDSGKVAEKASEAHAKIKALRKAMPQDRAWQRKLFEEAAQKEKDAWWAEVRPMMTRPTPGTDSEYWRNKKEHRDG